MTKTIRNRVVAATGLIAMLTSGPALAVKFMDENFSCDSASEDLGRIFEEHKAPESAGVVPMIEHLMWMLESAIGMMDANCSDEPGYAQQRADLNRSLNSARQACNQMSSSGSCYARRYN